MDHVITVRDIAFIVLLGGGLAVVAFVALWVLSVIAEGFDH